MKGKVLFVVGLATGYVLGTRAGRERYEQIASAARGVWNAAPVQKGVETAKEFALARVGDVSDTVFDSAKKIVKAAAKAASGNAEQAKKAASEAAASAKVAAEKAAAAAKDAAEAAAEATEEETGKAGSATKPAARKAPARKTAAKPAAVKRPEKS